MSYNSIQEIKEALPKVRLKFEKDVERICSEVIEIAKKISGAIGEISYYEAKQVIIREFLERYDKEIK